MVRRALDRLGGEGQTALRRIERASRPASKGLVAINSAAREGQNALRGYAAQAGPLGSVLGSMGKGGLAAAAAVGAFSAALSVRQLSQYADQWTQINNRISLFTSGATEARKVQEELFKVAKDTRSGLGATVELYQRLAQANERLNLTQQQLARITRTVNQAIAISGVTSEAANAAIIQLGQGLASGALRGDELRSVMEQVPALAQAIARGMGVTTAELRKMGEQGVLTAEAVVKSLRTQADAVATDFAKTTGTVGQAFTNMESSFTRLIGKIDEATNASGKLARAIDTMSGALSVLADGESPSTGGSDQSPQQRRQAGIERIVSLPQTSSRRQITDRLAFEVPEMHQFTITLPGGRFGAPAEGQGLRLPEEDFASAFSRELLFQLNAAAIKGIASQAGGIGVRPEVGRPSAPLEELDPVEETLRALGDASELLLSTEHPLVIAELERVNAEEDLKQKQEDLNRVLQGASGIMGRLLPQMRGFFDAAASLARGDVIGAGINAVHGLLDVFGVARNDSSELAQRMRDLSAAMKQAERSAINTALTMGGAVSEEMKTLQFEVVEPLLAALDARQARTGLSGVDNIKLFFDQLALIDEQGFGAAGTDLPQVLEQMGLSMVDLRLMIDRAFGDEATFREVGSRMFDVRDSFHDLFEELDAGAAKVTAAQNAVRTLFDAESIATRARFRGQFEAAGSDPYARAAAFRGLSDELSAVIRAGEATRRRVSRGLDSPSGAAKAPGPAADITAGGYDGRARDLVDVSNIDPTDVPWPSVVNMVLNDAARHVPEGWWNLVVLPDAAEQKYTRDWWKVVRMQLDDANRHEPEGWWNLVVLPDAAEQKYTRDWWKVVRMQLDDANRHEPESWSSLVQIPENLQKIHRTFLDAINVSEAENSGYGHPVDLRHKLEAWDSVVDISGATALDVHVRDIINIIGKIKLSDLIDLGELDRRIDGRADFNERNRRQSNGYAQYERGHRRTSGF